MKKAFSLFTAILIVGVISLTSCKDKEPAKPDCPTENMSFATDIKPILDLNCSVANCHDADAGQAGIFLFHHAGVEVAADTALLSIKHEAGVKPMPFPAGKDKLSDCDINKFAAWVAQGKKNN